MKFSNSLISATLLASTTTAFLLPSTITLSSADIHSNDVNKNGLKALEAGISRPSSEQDLKALKPKIEAIFGHPVSSPVSEQEVKAIRPKVEAIFDAVPLSRPSFEQDLKPKLEAVFATGKKIEADFTSSWDRVKAIIKGIGSAEPKAPGPRVSGCHRVHGSPRITLHGGPAKSWHPEHDEDAVEITRVYPTPGYHHWRVHHYHDGLPNEHAFHHHGFSILHTVVFGVLIPALIGIAAGVLASIVGLLVGSLISYCWIRFVRGGQRGNASEAMSDDDDEKMLLKKGGDVEEGVKGSAKERLMAEFSGRSDGVAGYVREEEEALPVYMEKGVEVQDVHVESVEELPAYEGNEE